MLMVDGAQCVQTSRGMIEPLELYAHKRALKVLSISITKRRGIDLFIAFSVYV